MMQCLRVIACITAIVCFWAVEAAAASYPEKPVTYIVPFAPGGESDIFASAQRPLLEKALGQKVLISYVVGKGGGSGWKRLQHSRPDGYTVSGFNLPHIVLQPLLDSSVEYATESLSPVMIFMSTPCILVVHKDSPYTSLQDFLNAAGKHPNELTLGGSGSYSANYLGCKGLMALSGVRFRYVDFAGTGDAVAAFLAKRTTGLFTYSTMGIQYAQSMRVLAIASRQRLPELPNVPTFIELGYDLVEGAARGVAVPAETPPDVVERLYAAFARVNSDPAFVRKMASLGFTMENLGPDDARRFIEERQRNYKTVLSTPD